MTNQRTAEKAGLLNAKVQRFMAGTGHKEQRNIRVELTREDIAYGLGCVQERYGSLLFRVRWAQQQEYVMLVIVETIYRTQQLDRERQWELVPKTLERMAILALREDGIIRPKPVPERWNMIHAEMYTDKKEQAKCPKCEIPARHRVPGERVICHNKPSCTRKDYIFNVLSRKQRWLWATVANNCAQQGMNDGEIIKLANDVVAGHQDYNFRAIEKEWVPGLEVCRHCHGAKSRQRGHRIITCPSCEDGARLWRDDTKRQYLGVSRHDWRTVKRHYHGVRVMIYEQSAKTLERILEKM